MILRPLRALTNKVEVLNFVWLVGIRFFRLCIELRDPNGDLICGCSHAADVS